MKQMGKILIAIFIMLSVWACGDDKGKSDELITDTLDQQAEGVVGDSIEEGALESVEDAAASKKKATDLTSGDYVPKVYPSGRYVLQVGVSPSQAIAQRLVRKIEDKGFTAYITTVENPADLVGTYYRVRVGYFKTLTEARLFGHSVLMPMNIAFWIDNKVNDAVANPITQSGEIKSEEAVEVETEEAEEVEFEEVKPAPTPAAAPVASPAPVSSAPAKEVSKAAEPEPAIQPAAQPKSQSSAAPSQGGATKNEEDWATSEDEEWSNDEDWGK